MKKISSFALGFALLLTSCGGPQTVAYGTATLTYDSGTWESFSNDLATGLNVKGDESCWIDLKGDLTKPRADEDLEQASNGAVTLYTNPTDGSTVYVSFVDGSETVYGRVSVENGDSCVGELMALADGTLGE